MAFLNNYNLSNDPIFRGRVFACIKQQALIYKDDGRYGIATLANAIIASSGTAGGLFELVCVAPGFGDEASQDAVKDGDILAAVQAMWPVYGDIVYPPPPPAP
jgi:hypothetical protein